MTDPHSARAKAFRGRWLFPWGRGDFEQALLAEIKWARENPPDIGGMGYDTKKDYGLAYWQSFADHLLACLGVEK